MSKILVAYFSATGTTGRAAKSLAEAAGADLFEIVPAIPYEPADLDWMDKKSRNVIEMNDPECRPAIAGKVPDMGQYDTVFVGFPVWWYTARRIINTFLESGDFAGKTLIPFATSGGSGIGNVEKDLAPSAPGAVFKPGRRLGGGDTVKMLEAWVKELGL